MMLVRIAWSLMVLLAGVMLVYTSVLGLVTIYREKAPARYTPRTLAEAYRGERWLQITGRLRFDAMQVRYGKVSVHESTPTYRVRIAMQDAADPDDAPVRVLWSSGPFRSQQEVDAWQQRLKATPTQTLTGLRKPLNGDRADLFPTLKFDDPISLNEGQSPPERTVGHWFLLGLGAVVSLVSGRRLWRAARG